MWVSYGRETVTVRISGHLTGVLEQLKARFPDSRITVEEVRTTEVPTGWVLPVTLSVTTGDDILLQVNVMDVTLSPVPDVCGLPYEQAREVLEKAGFTVEMDVYTGTDTPEKTVGATLPAAGEYVLPGSKVTVYYRMG